MTDTSSALAPATTSSDDWVIGNLATSSSEPKDDPNGSTHTMVNYYFVFIGLAVVVITIAAVVTWTRKQRLALLRDRSERHDPAPGPWHDLNAWEQNRANRHSRFGHRRSNEYTREEGLNEHGEAPPPYVPPPTQRGEGIGIAPPIVPLRTLSRDQAGLKPPDYRA